MSAWQHTYATGLRQSVLVEHISPTWCNSPPAQPVLMPPCNSYNQEHKHHFITAHSGLPFTPTQALQQLCVSLLLPKSGCYRKRCFWEACLLQQQGWKLIIRCDTWKTRRGICGSWKFVRMKKMWGVRRRCTGIKTGILNREKEEGYNGKRGKVEKVQD